MGYYQMIFNFGEKKFIKKCKETGVDGLIVVDLSYPDNKKFALLCKKNSISASLIIEILCEALACLKRKIRIIKNKIFMSTTSLFSLFFQN